jgi:hypothetical protein
VVDNGLLAPELAAGITRIKGVTLKGVRIGNWLSIQQAQTLLNAPSRRTRADATGQFSRCSWDAVCAREPLPMGRSQVH